MTMIQTVYWGHQARAITDGGYAAGLLATDDALNNLHRTATLPGSPDRWVVVGCLVDHAGRGWYSVRNSHTEYTRLVSLRMMTSLS
jgi:hypothetical protein